MTEIDLTVDDVNKAGRPTIESNFLRCPVCRQAPLRVHKSDTRCDACGFVAHFIADVLDLRLDASQDTALDLDTYDEHHTVNEESASSIIDFYNSMIRDYAQAQPGRVLEIGAGTGNLTWGLCNQSSFSEVHCSDISPRFMARLHAKLSKDQRGGKLHSYLFDANDFPFADQSFSAVLGHSVLHHLAGFETAVQNAHRVLVPGGVAIFGEPIMEAHALIFLAARLIVQADRLHEKRQLSPQSELVLSAIAARGVTMMRLLMKRTDEVNLHEDKYYFPVDYMRNLSKRFGFSRFEIVQYAQVQDLGAMIEEQLASEMNGNSSNGMELLPFRPLLQAFTDAYEPSMASFLSQPFAFLVYVK